VCVCFGVRPKQLDTRSARSTDATYAACAPEDDRQTGKTRWGRLTDDRTRSLD
jgi:hypothetical protein